MKKHTPKTKKKAGRKSKFKPAPHTLEMMAIVLSNFAKVKLRDGVLQGRIRGIEEDVRQEAVIIAIGWLAKHLTSGKSLKSWNPLQAISMALRYSKLRHLRRLDKSPHTILMEHLPEDTCDHPSQQNLADRSIESKRAIVSCAIHAARQSGSITNDNAQAANLVLVKGMSVVDAAKLMHITRSAVYQHLGRAKRHIRKAMEEVDAHNEM